MQSRAPASLTQYGRSRRRSAQRQDPLGRLRVDRVPASRAQPSVPGNLPLLMDRVANGYQSRDVRSSFAAARLHRAWEAPR